MVAVINTWRQNPLANMRRDPEAHEAWLRLARRMFVQQMVIDMYEGKPPFDYVCCEEIDELGQWGDDGGRCCD